MATTKKRKAGRYTKLTPEVEETILRHLRTGGYQVHAAEAAGVTYDAMRKWILRGEAGERVYADFATKVRKVLAEDALRSQSIITRAALGGDWKAAAWSLERKHPKLYGQAARQAAATVTINNAGESDAEGNTTRVQFYLPDNGRRPQDDEDGEA